MELKFSKINGTNKHLDYDVFKNSIIDHLKKTCQEAELIILNRFPIAVTAQASIDFLIFLNIPNRHRSWYRVPDNDNWVYVRNQFIAVSVIDDYKDENLEIDGNQIETSKGYINVEEDAVKIKYGLTNYLADKCGLTRKHITIHPLIWVKNKNTIYSDKDILVGNNFTYESVENVIKKNFYFKYAGYIDWYNNSLIFEQQIKRIYEQASKDSKEGYITKKKIDRIQRKFGVKQDEALKLIGSKLVEVKGKAGTGKTSELLKWMLFNSLEGNRGVFLTYNHLLVYDIASQIQSFQNRQSDDSKKATTTTYTIHGFFYNIAKK